MGNRRKCEECKSSYDFYVKDIKTRTEFVTYNKQVGNVETPDSNWFRKTHTHDKTFQLLTIKKTIKFLICPVCGEENWIGCKKIITGISEFVNLAVKCEFPDSKYCYFNFWKQERSELGDDVSEWLI